MIVAIKQNCVIEYIQLTHKNRLDSYEITPEHYMKCKTARCSGKTLGVAPLLPSLAIVGSLRNQSRSVLSSARDEKNTGLASAPCRLASLKEMPAFQRTISYGVLKTTIHCWQLIPRLNLVIVSRRASLEYCD